MKDAKGHGSDTGTKGMRLIKTHTLGPHSAKVYNNPDWNEKVVKFFHNGQYQSKADSHTDDLADAHATAQFQLKRYADQDAKASLASGPKSAPVPTHDSMSSFTPWPKGTRFVKGTLATSDDLKSRGLSVSKSDTFNASKGSSYNEHGSRHGYNPDSVNEAIKNNRTGKIGGREAKMIHALLKGR